MRNVTIKRIATITLTASDWELYDPAPGMPARLIDAAVKDLNQTLEKALNADNALPNAVRAAMDPVLKKHMNVGAFDTEPRATLNDIIRLYFGI